MLYVLLIIMVLSWSANFVVAKFTLQEVPPFALLVNQRRINSAPLPNCQKELRRVCAPLIHPLPIWPFRSPTK